MIPGASGASMGWGGRGLSLQEPTGGRPGLQESDRPDVGFIMKSGAHFTLRPWEWGLHWAAWAWGRGSGTRVCLSHPPQCAFLTSVLHPSAIISHLESLALVKGFLDASSCLN